MIGHFLKSIWMAVRSFSLGVLVGLLTAPNRGSVSRRVIRERFLELYDRVLPSSEHR